MKISKKLFNIDVEVLPIRPTKKKKLLECIEMAEKEIKEWNEFKKECESKLYNIISAQSEGNK